VKDARRFRKAKKTSEAQKRRIRVAYTTIAVFICAFSALVVVDFQGKPAPSISAAQYLLTEAYGEQDDPLGLVNRISCFELTGVCADGSVIGYASDMSWQQSSMLLTSILLSDGWVLLDNNGQGLLSFQRKIADSTGSTGAADGKDGRNSTGAAGTSGSAGTSGFTFLFVQCMSLGQGSSIVVQRW